MMTTGRKKRNRGMITTVLNYLKEGNEISAIQASSMWNELNVRNKISILREEGWPITSSEEPSKHGGYYKVYSLNMDRVLWPKDNA